MKESDNISPFTDFIENICQIITERKEEEINGIYTSRNTDIKIPFFRGRPSALQKMHYKLLLLPPNINYNFKEAKRKQGLLKGEIR
jgi:hypothetical protein